MYVCCTRTEVAMQHGVYFINKTCIPVARASNFSVYATGGRLVGERTKRPSSFVLSECLFSDDAALVCSCREDVVLAARVVATENGLTLSVPKTKLLVAGLGLTIDDLAQLELDGGVVEVVEQFKYFGLK